MSRIIETAGGARVTEPVTVRPHGSKRGHWVLRTSQWLPRSLDELWRFFSDAHNLERITPPFLKFRVLTEKDASLGMIDMHAGRLIDYQLRVRGVPVRWRTEISTWEPPHRFVDQQLRGPYVRWHHTHTFVEQDGGTLCSDEVEYAPPGWVLRPLVNALAVQRDVSSIFRYRQGVLGEMFGG